MTVLPSTSERKKWVCLPGNPRAPLTQTLRAFAPQTPQNASGADEWAVDVLEVCWVPLHDVRPGEAGLAVC